MFENLVPTGDGASYEPDEDGRLKLLDGVRLPLEEPTENHEQI
jgi:hypothetical protein